MNTNKGRFGQFIAECFMINKGSTCITRNYRYSGGEVDLVMLKGEALLFIEVKTHIVRSISKDVICETINNYAIKLNKAKMRRMRLGVEGYFVKHETIRHKTPKLLWLEVFIKKVSYETAMCQLGERLHVEQMPSVEPKRLISLLEWGESDYSVEEVDLCLLCPL